MIAIAVGALLVALFSGGFCAGYGMGRNEALDAAADELAAARRQIERLKEELARERYRPVRRG